MTHRYYCQVSVLPFDATSTNLYQELVREGLRIGAQDMKIAAITLSRNAILVTSNLRHFDQVPGLHIEDWMQ